MEEQLVAADDTSVDAEEEVASEETPQENEDAVQSAKESLLNTLEQMERDVAQQFQPVSVQLLASCGRGSLSILFRNIFPLNWFSVPVELRNYLVQKLDITTLLFRSFQESAELNVNGFSNDAEEIVQPPLLPMEANGQQIAVSSQENFAEAVPESSTETTATPAAPISITIEEDHKIYVAPKRRTMALNDSLLTDLQNALKEGGVNIVEVQGLKRKLVRI